MDDEKIDLDQRYWYFSYATYYPAGGLGDLKYTSDSIEDIYEEASSGCISTNPSDHNMILDTKERERIGFDRSRVDW